jgi:hypothetical protein
VSMCIRKLGFGGLATVLCAVLFGASAAPALASGKPTVETKPATSIGETEATLNGLVNPNGAATKYYFEYGTTISYGSETAGASAGSGTSNVEESKVITGLAADTTYDFRIVATNTNGTAYGSNQVFSTTTWSFQEPLAPTGAKSSGLTAGVSCTSSTACTAVGNFINSSAVEMPLAERWNGTIWSAQEPPLPAGATSGSLGGVSCVSSVMCMAVGSFTNSLEKSVPMAESWNGTTWSAQELPRPTEAKTVSLSGVSCVSSKVCEAAGTFESSAGKDLPLAESWNGTTWSVQEPPAPTEAKLSTLKELSCVSSTACTAVGLFENSSGKSLPLAERWNGTAWSVQEPPSPTESKAITLVSVSCTSSTACVAVGSFIRSATWVPLAERWNGTTWSVQEPPLPPGEAEASPYGVSCTSEAACIAVGSFSSKPLAERWNGTTWSVQKPPAPTGSTGNNLYGGVSCTSSTMCMAAGEFANSASEDVPLVEDYH